MAYRGDLAGAAHLVLADGVAYLDPATAMYRAMLEGWEIQQRSRMLKKLTIKGRVRLIERFMEYAVSEQLQHDHQPADTAVSVIERVQHLELIVGQSRPNHHRKLR